MSADPEIDLQEKLDRLSAEIAALRAGQDLLVEVLATRGDIGPGHEKLLQRIRKAVQAAPAPPRVRLRVLRDKHQVTGPDIDCPSLVHLCKARCCTLNIELSVQDIEDGVRFEVQQPYLIRHEEDRYCTHMDRATGGCTVYERRPATCREYDCRLDKRVWIDFEKRLPAPMFEGVGPFPRPAP